MSDINVTIGADAREFQATLSKVYETAEGLRANFSMTSREIDKEMKRLAMSTKTLDASFKTNANTIRDYKNRIDQLNLAITAQEKLLSKSKNQSVEAREAIKKLKEEKNKLKITLTELNKKQNEYSKGLETLKARSSQVAAAQSSAASGTGGLTAGLGELYGIANQVLGVFGTGLSLYGFIRLLKSATHTIKKFEKSQLELAAVSGATAREMDVLSRQAILIGASTKYGAQGVSELQVQLARMGFTINQIGKMAVGITNLATAAGEDLPKAAETVAFTLRAYNLRASETTRVTDVMAASFTKSALDLEKFRQSIKYIGPIANQANFSIEDTAALLGRLADAGISGSLAGTSLRNVLSQLADGSSAISQRIGFAVKNFDDFTKALRLLNEQGIDLGGVFGIIDRRAATAFTSLLTNVDALEAFHDEMLRASGAAERMAKIQKESLSYQTKLATAAWEGFVVAVDKGDGALSRIIKGSLTTFSGVMNNFTENLKKQSTQIEKELANMTVLWGVADNANASLYDRINALKDLKAQYPEYFENIKDDIETSKDLTLALDQVVLKVEDLRQMLKGKVRILIETENVDKAQKNLDKLNEKIFKQAILLERTRIEKEKLEEKWGEESAITLGPIERRLQRLLKRQERAQEKLKEAEEERIRVALTLRSTLTASYLDVVRDAGLIDEAVAKNIQSFTAQIDQSKSLAEIEKLYGDKIRQNNVLLQNRKELAEKFLPNSAEEKQNQQDILVLNETNNQLNQDFLVLEQKRREEQAKQVDLLRLQAKLRELEIRYAEEGFEEQKKLAKLRLDTELKLADIEGGDKGILMRRIANQEYLNELQKINQEELKSDNAKNAELRKNAEELNKLMRRLSDERANFELSAIDRRNYQERQRLEVESQEITSQRIIEDIYNRAEEEKKVLYDKLQEELALIGGNNIEKARLEQEYQDRVKAIDEETKNEILVAEEEDLSKQRELYRKQLNERIAIENEILDERLAIFDAQQEQEKILFDSKRQNEVAIRNFEKQQAIARLEELKVLAEARKAVLEQELTDLGDKDPFQTAELERQLEGLQRTIDTLDLQIEFEPFDKEAWDEMLSALKNLGKEVGDTLKKMTKDREDAAKREREILDGRIAEAQRAVELELKTYELGHAANVETKRKELAELEKLRANALKAEEKAIAQRRAMDAVLQATNLITAVSQIIRSQSLAGPVGIALAAGGIAAMFALFNNAKKLSSQTTKYEKGGSFTLKGRSHASGGVLLAPGHEAQGGEQVSVFNRSATKRFGSQIRQFTDDINKGKNPLQNINVFADSKDLKAMRKIMEREQVEYHDSYKVIRRGNVTTICRN